MHQVHAVAEFRYFGDEPRGLRLVYTAEHQEGSCSKEHTVDGTESPSDFYNRSGQIFSGYRLDIKRVDRPHCSDNHQSDSCSEAFGAAPGEVGVHIMCHDQVTEEAGEIEQHVEFVPETLSPNFSPPAVEIRHAGR